MDPQASREHELALWIAERIARELKLPKERIDPREAIARYGMDSLRAVSLVADLEDHLGIQLDVAAAWDYPTIEALAKHLVTLVGSGAGPAEAAVGSDGATGIQRTIARIQSRYEGSYVTARALRLRGPLDLDRFQDALRRLIERHPMLRTGFVPGPGGLVAKEHPSAPLELACEDAQGLSAEALSERLTLLANLTCDPARPPLVKLSLLKVATEEHLFILAVSHLIFDAWSFFIVARDLDVLLSTPEGETPALEPLPSRYLDLVEGERRQLEREGGELEAFWRTQLQDGPHWAPIASDRPRGGDDALWVAARAMSLGVPLTQAVSGLAASCEATAFHVMISAYALLLSRRSGQARIPILSMVDRRYPKQRHVVGPFVNHVSFLLDTEGDPTVSELVHRTRVITQAALSRKALPFDRVLEVSGAGWEDRARLPLFQLQCHYYDFRAGAEQAPVYREMTDQLQQRAPVIRLGALSAEMLPIPRRKAPFDLSLSVSAGDQLDCKLEYATARFDAATVEVFLADYRELLEQMVRDPLGRCAGLGAGR